jgi:dihydrofolate reductase
MREIVAGLFITLDGVTEEPSNWQEDFDDEMLAALQTHISETDAILLGRVTYEYWKDYWPTATYEPFASHINEKPKYVASTSLHKVEWGGKTNIALLEGDTIEALKTLKSQPGKRISVAGSPTLVRYLLDQDMLDELQLMIHPVVAGSGRHLFESAGPLKRLKLKTSIATRTGTVIATYQARR